MVGKRRTLLFASGLIEWISQSLLHRLLRPTHLVENQSLSIRLAMLPTPSHLPIPHPQEARRLDIIHRSAQLLPFLQTSPQDNQPVEVLCLNRDLLQPDPRI